MKQHPNSKAKRRELADSWGSFCAFARDPIAAWEATYSLERIKIDSPMLGGISAMIAPFVFLADVGTSQSLGAELNTLREAAATVRRHSPGHLQAEHYRETVRRIEAEIPRFERMRRAAALAENLLRKYGYKYDPKTGKVGEDRKRRGSSLLVRLIQRLGAEYRNTPAGRNAIKIFLSTVFDAADLDSGPKGNIAHALENLKRTAAPSK